MPIVYLTNIESTHKILILKKNPGIILLCVMLNAIQNPRIFGSKKKTVYKKLIKGFFSSQTHISYRTSALGFFFHI